MKRRAPGRARRTVPRTPRPARAPNPSATSSPHGRAQPRRARATMLPEMPDGVVDRAADVWEPLIAIADSAGDQWPERARAAAVTLNSATRRARPEPRRATPHRLPTHLRRTRGPAHDRRAPRRAPRARESHGATSAASRSTLEASPPAPQVRRSRPASTGTARPPRAATSSRHSTTRGAATSPTMFRTSGMFRIFGAGRETRHGPTFLQTEIENPPPSLSYQACLSRRTAVRNKRNKRKHAGDLDRDLVEHLDAELVDPDKEAA